MSKQVQVAIITIGDEILYGQTLDTNSQWLSIELDKAGFSLVHKATVGDKEKDIVQALDFAGQHADVILITGGLGPTADDLTKPVLARYFGVELAPNEAALQELKELFRQIKRELTDSNIAQTYLPANASHITNRLGTAPGIWIEDNGKVYVSMPGVPHEMKTMMSEQVLPRLKEKFHLPEVVHKMIKTIGIGESWLAEKIAPWERQLPAEIKLAYLPSPGQVKLRLTMSGSDPAAMRKAIDEEVQRLQPYAGKYIYGYDQDEIEQVIGDLLRNRRQTLATAESCTGGYLAHLITSVAGSSDYYQGSIIAYANEVKERELGVSAATLQKHGAVSEETVSAMAEGVKNRLGTDYGLATSGIAGPGGGTPDKPVGTVWIAVAHPHGTSTKLLNLFKNREINIRLSTIFTLGLLWRILTGKD